MSALSEMTVYQMTFIARSANLFSDF